jgi:outer membrane receptor protein involved in Fe transport
MTRKTPVSGALCAIAISALAFVPQLSAQTTTAAPAASTKNDASTNDEDVVVLSPFTTTAGDVSDGYQVRDTLGGTRVRTKLSDVASSISVVSKKQLEDMGITNNQGLLTYTTDTEVAGLNGNYSGVAARGFGVQGTAENGRLGNPNAVNRARGLTAMDNTRNYFLSEIPWDSFNIDRVDISRGPNSFLFGVGSPSGISNASTNEAVWKDKGELQFRYGSFNSSRESLDYNKVILPKELAFRLDLLNDDEQYQQKPAYNHAKRLYTALRYDPRFLNADSAHTSIKANAEFGRVRSNNPREIPPADYITGYFDGQVSKTGYDPFVYSGLQSNASGSYSTSAYGGKSPVNLSPWVNGQDIHYIWPGPTAAFWYDASTGATVDERTTLNGANSTGTHTLAKGVLDSMGQTVAMYTSGFSSYAKTMNQRDATLYPGAYAGTVNYSDKSLTDSSIFDFYNKLIDGDNKREWQNWRSFNLVADQSFFDGRLSLQATFDYQKFDFGNEGILSGYMQPYISVDLDAYKIVYPSAISGSVKNENEGRAFIGSDFGNSNGSTQYIHNNEQLLVNGEIRADDFMDAKSTAAKIIGTHSFTGLVAENKTKTDTRNWTLYATDKAFASAMGDSSGIISSSRNISWVAYLGDSMADKTSASGLNLNNLSKTIQPTSGTISHFDNTWTAASTVDPTAPWTNPADPAGTYQQNDNPANYKGWTNIPVTVLNSKDNINDLYESGTKSLERLKSESFMYQGSMFDDMFLPMAGYRRDTVRQRSSNAPLDKDTHVASMDYGITGADAVEKTTSKSYGFTLHLPKSLRGKLPLDSDLSFHYFHGVNGTPKVRYGFDGNQLPIEHGKTDDYSVSLDMLKGRATVRLTYFKTMDYNGAAGSGVSDPLGSNGYYLYLLPAWGAADAAATGMYVADANNNGGSFTTVKGTSSATASQIAAVQDWQANFGKTFSQSFFDAYGLGLNVDAISSGNFANVFNNTNTYPYPWNIANTGNGKVNGSFPIVSQDLESKGWELEATVRPVDNWDITFNISKVQAIQTALGQSTVDFVLKEKAFFDGPAGQLPLWGYWNGTFDSGSTLQHYFYSNIWSAYLTQTAQLGTAQPELRNWNAKAVTNYSFTTGYLKGFSVGGGVRWASKPILGYGVHQVLDDLGNTIWLNDPSKPLYGKIDEHCDFWVGYSRKINSKINWKIQLNIQNVFEKARLAPVTVEPNGDWAQMRILQGQTFNLTNTFSF